MSGGWKQRTPLPRIRHRGEEPRVSPSWVDYLLAIGAGALLGVAIILLAGRLP